MTRTNGLGIEHKFVYHKVQVKRPDVSKALNQSDAERLQGEVGGWSDVLFTEPKVGVSYAHGMGVAQAANELLRVVEERRVSISDQLDTTDRSRLGQFFTPLAVAQFMASLPSLPLSGRLRVLDPGAGNGSLTAALVARIVSERPDIDLDVTVFEVDETLCPELEQTLTGCRQLARQAGCHMTARLIVGDFLEWAATSVGRLPFEGEGPAQFDLVIMNPPYRKVNVAGAERRALQSIDVEVTNLYAAFVAMAIALLDVEGQIAAITPRSFTNGPYFRSFRRYFFGKMLFERLHVYESRSKAFAGDAVLQENIIFGARRRRSVDIDPSVVISTSDGPSDLASTRVVPHSEIVLGNDPERFVHIMADNADAAVGRSVLGLPSRIKDLKIEVSTGRVVDFRAKEHLRFEPQLGAVPLIYPGHLRGGGIAWPGALHRKPSWIVACVATASLLLPTATYVVVKRFTSKEERRRVVAAVFGPSDVSSDVVAFENHLNVFHVNGNGLSPDIARGLAAWLNSTVVDRYVRSFNGHTQINATDLRRLPYPAAAELQRLGTALGEPAEADQEKIDSLVSVCVKELRDTAA